MAVALAFGGGLATSACATRDAATRADGATDLCPDADEDIDGDEDADGCPEVDCDDCWTTFEARRVHFARGSNSVSGGSVEVVAHMASEILARPELGRVAVRGAPARVRAVMAELVRDGVPTDRLEAVDLAPDDALEPDVVRLVVLDPTRCPPGG